jgi:acyl-CoA thioester hydrolase
VVDMTMRWHRPARYDDELLISARPTERRGTTLHFRQEARRGTEVLASAEVRVAALNATTFRPVRIPPRVIERLGDIGRTASAGAATDGPVGAAPDAGPPSPIADRPVPP